jgi:hypothetical protein
LLILMTRARYACVEIRNSSDGRNPASEIFPPLIFSSGERGGEEEGEEKVQGRQREEEEEEEEGE